MRFSPNTLGNLIYRTRLKIAASDCWHFSTVTNDFDGLFRPAMGMLPERHHRDNSDAFGFAKGDFESGLAARLLNGIWG